MPDENSIELGISIEESDNPTEWTTIGGRLIPSIEIPIQRSFIALQRIDQAIFVNHDQSN